MENIERENRKTSKYKKYTAVSIIILSLFIFYLCTNGLIAEITGGYQSFLYDWLGKTNKWSGTFGPEKLVDTMNGLSALASRLFISLFSVIFGGYLIIRKKYRTLFTYLFVVIGAAIFHVFLKNYYSGESWYNWFNVFILDGKGFPSGHAFMSVVFYFTMARLIYRANPERKLNRYLFTMSFLLCFVIGISLLITAAHSPNEIIAGWSIGFVWISAAWLVDHYVRKKIYYRHHVKETELTKA
jgi:undecaprenyl-diphosphatase